ncbi:MAG: hypothetical protein IT184_11820 [Acidobacteria bacterium]|nr:hypothetical protein [Acidobacteriota bacterium]
MTDRHEQLVRELAKMMRDGADGAAIHGILARVAPEDRDDVLREAQRQAGLEHEGALEDDVSDTRGPGPGFDDEPEKVDDKGGVIS